MKHSSLEIYAVKLKIIFEFVLCCLILFISAICMATKPQDCSDPVVGFSPEVKVGNEMFIQIENLSFFVNSLSEYSSLITHVLAYSKALAEGEFYISYPVFFSRLENIPGNKTRIALNFKAQLSELSNNLEEKLLISSSAVYSDLSYILEDNEKISQISKELPEILETEFESGDWLRSFQNSSVRFSESTIDDKKAIIDKFLNYLLFDKIPQTLLVIENILLEISKELKFEIKIILNQRIKDLYTFPYVKKASFEYVVSGLSLKTLKSEPDIKSFINNGFFGSVYDNHFFSNISVKDFFRQYLESLSFGTAAKDIITHSDFFSGYLFLFGSNRTLSFYAKIYNSFSLSEKKEYGLVAPSEFINKDLSFLSRYQILPSRFF